MKWNVQLLKKTELILNSEINRWLIGSMLFSVTLILFRIVYTRELTFIFLVWNLFLAFIPYSISTLIEMNFSSTTSKWKLAIPLMSWLLFIPNSFYIITDLFHLGISNMPIWFETALLLSFAWNGLILGILSVQQIEKVIHKVLPKMNEYVFLIPVMCLNAFGIYIGRFLRFNSWDVISNPFALAVDITNLIIHPIAYKNAWAMITCYAVLMTFIYLIIKRINPPAYQN